MPFENPEACPMQVDGTRSAQATLDWLEEFRQALQVLQWFQNTIIGGGDGVMAFGDDEDDSGRVMANTSPNMTVKIRPFAGFVANVPFRVPDELVTAALTAPSSNARIDTVVAKALPGLEGEFAIRTGTESASPTAPSAAADEILLAWIHHRVGETSIKNTDDATNGYIEDKRTYINR